MRVRATRPVDTRGEDKDRLGARLSGRVDALLEKLEERRIVVLSKCFADGRARVDRLLRSCQGYALGLQLVDYVLQILDATRESVLVRSLQQ